MAGKQILSNHRKIRWLHLSDIHMNTTEVESLRLRRKLPEYLAGLNQHFDYIFFTGDLKFAGAGRPCKVLSLDDISAYFKSICNAAGVPMERLFIVPGNHDIDRNFPGREEAIHRIFYRHDSEWSGYYNPMLGEIKEEDFAPVYGSETGFREVIEALYAEFPKRRELYSNESNPHFVVETEDINVLHVDSTIVQNGMQQKDLILGTGYLMAVLEEINPEKPTILLTHYAFNYLDANERKEIAGMLLDYHIELWLAGHEHDHLVKPEQYIHSMQCGNLVFEDGAKSSILIGELDLVTGHGCVEAHAWYPRDGWALYPFIWNKGEDKAHYFFELDLPCQTGYMSRETARCIDANKRYLKPGHKFFGIDFTEKLMTDYVFQGRKYSSDEGFGILNLLQDIWKESGVRHVILSGDGGVGKSTSMYFACRKLAEQSHIPALYFNLEALESNGEDIITCICRILYDNRDAREELFQFLKEYHHNPSLYLFLDGMNEVAPETAERYIRQMKQLSAWEGIQIVITSRDNNLGIYGLGHFQSVCAVGLPEHRERELLGERWEEVCKEPVLVRLLKNPFMLLLYQKACPLQEKYQEEGFLGWKKSVKTAADIISNYYTAQIANMLERTGIQGSSVMEIYLIIRCALPYLGYRYEKAGKMGLDENALSACLTEAVSLMNQVLTSAEVAAIRRRYRLRQVCVPDEFLIQDVLCNELCLLGNDGRYVVFPHQTLRDFLSASYIHECTLKNVEEAAVIWNERYFSGIIMEYLRSLGGEYWADTGVAGVLSYYLRGKTADSNLVMMKNMIDCYSYTRDSGIPNLSELDLRDIRLRKYEMQQGKILLQGAQISRYSLGLERRRKELFVNAVFSPNKTELAASRGGCLHIYSMVTGRKILCKMTGEQVKYLRYSPSGNYLFVFGFIQMEPEIVVWHKECESAWNYKGKITILHLKTLQNIIIARDESQVCLYHNNREVKYSLPDCSKIDTKNTRHAYEKRISGSEMLDINLMWSNPYKREKSVRNSDGSLSAVSGEEGSLAVYDSDGKVVYILEEGIVRLRDGAISASGTAAVTLSEKLYLGQRKITIWDVEARCKQGELLCDKSVNKIHISDTDKWILCETMDTTIIISRSQEENKYILPYHFISNQKGRLSFYRDRVLRGGSDERIEWFDLNSRESSGIDFPSERCILAAIMPDESLLAVKKNRRTAILKNSRTGEIMENLNREKETVIGVAAMKNKPFAAIATSDGKISIYHTGTGQRVRIFDSKIGNQIISMHPQFDVIAAGGRNGLFGTWNLYTKPGTNKSRWYENKSRRWFDGPVLDLAFQEKNNELVAIGADGQIIYSHGQYCIFHSAAEIILDLDVEQYDFTGAVMDDELREQVLANGGFFRQ